MKNTKLAISIGLVIASVIILIYFSDIFFLVVVAAVIAFILNPLASLFTKKLKIKKVFAVLMVFVLIVLLFVLLLSLIIPHVAEQFTMLSNNMDTYMGNIQHYYDMLKDRLTELHVSPIITEKLDEFMSTVEQFISALTWSIASSIVGFTMKIFDIIVVITISLYLMLDTRKGILKISRFLPEKTGHAFTKVVSQCSDVTWRYLKTKTLISFAMAITTLIVLSIIGVQYALLLALIAFVLDYIPYFGSIVSGIIAALVAFATGSLSQMFIVLICILIIQQIEGNVIVPKIQGESVGLHPITVLLALLMFNKIMGPLGMFIAVPLFGIFKIILREIYKYIIQPD